MALVRGVEDDGVRVGFPVDDLFEQLVVVGRAAQADVPGDGRCLHGPDVQHPLEPAVPHRAHVPEDTGWEPGRGGRRHRDDGVPRLLVIVGELESHPVVQETDVEPGLHLGRALGLQV